jgi:hypothetical protein
VAVTSAVVDASLCLLLVSAAAITVVAAEPPEPGSAAVADAEGRADAVAASLATRTASVNYSLAPGARRASRTDVRFPRVGGPEFRRYDHGSVAGLLADAAVATVSVGGRPLTHAHDDYARRVRDATRSATREPRVAVVAVWRPYPGASVRGRVAVGPRPPADATVHAATIAVPSGVPSARRAAANASPGGFDAVAAVIARRTVAGLFPPDELRYALRADYPVSALARHRYLRAGRLLDADVREPVASGRTRRANDLLTEALADRVERDLRREFDSPRAAARAVDVSRTTVVVRTWRA